MSLALLLGFASVIGLLSFSLQPVVRKTDWMWLSTLTFGVAALAALAPSPWVAGIVVWIAIHPWWTFLGAWRGILPDVPRETETYRYLWPVGLWMAVYLGVGWGLDGSGLRVVAMIWIGWAVLNACAVFYQWSGCRLPWWWRVTEGMPISGWVGGSFFCSYVLCLGLLSALFLGGWWLAAVPICVVALLPLRHYAAPASCAVALLVLLPWPFSILPVLGAGGLFWYKVRQRHRGVVARLQRWALAGQLVELSQGWGIGLGAFSLLAPVESERGSMQIFSNLHNDWLQGLVELGPLPVIFALMEIGGRILWPLPGAGPAFALSVILFTAVLATAYFPLHHPSQALVLAIALGVRA